MNRRWAILIAAGLVVSVGTLFARFGVGDDAAWIKGIMTSSVGGGLLVLLAAWWWRDERPGRRWLLAVMMLGVVLRLVAVSTTRELSDDAARYHWDGKVLSHGINPYLYAPDAAAVAHLKIHAIDRRINHPWNRTCYPPLAELVFALGYRLSPGRLTGLQVLALLGEILAWLLLARELDRRRRSLGWLLPMIWGPLLVFQGYLPGHVDVFNLPLVTLLILSVLAGRERRAGLYLALCCLIKPLPLLMLPAMARALGVRRTARALAVFAIVMVAAYLPFLSAGWKLFSSTWLMATDWSFNGSIGALLETVLSLRHAHLLSALSTGMLIVWSAWKSRDFLAAALASQLAFVALTPTLFSWYLIGMFPLLVLRPRPALLALGALAPLSDEVIIGFRATGVWRPAAWAACAQYIPFYGLLAARWFNNHSRRRGRPPGD